MQTPAGEGRDVIFNGMQMQANSFFRGKTVQKIVLKMDSQGEFVIKEGEVAVQTPKKFSIKDIFQVVIADDKPSTETQWIEKKKR